METMLTVLAFTAFFALCACWATFSFDEERAAEQGPSARGLSAM